MPIRVPRQYRAELDSAAAEAGLPDQVAAAQISTESGFDPNAVSPTGAEGIAQFEPGTWPSWGHGSPFNPADAFPAYGAYMGSLMQEFNLDMRDALAGYNAGAGNLQAGYGYADQILGQAGYPTSAKGKEPLSGVPYANPLRDVQNLTPERVDMGVDYSGTGPVYALGPGVITNTENSGWPGGAFIGEKITEGPAAGRYVYMAENVSPTVSVGQHVDDSTQIGLMSGGIETGWAEAPGTGNALGASQFTGSNATAYGASYSDLLKSLGAPPGVVSGPVTGTVPGGWYSGQGGTFLPPGGPGGGAGSLFGVDVSGITNSLGAIAAAISRIEHGIEWFLVPNHWVRIFSGLFGTGFIAWGLWSMSRTGRAYSANVPVVGQVPVPEGGQLAPALGIAAVTVGSVLLFFAFHNLPSDVKGMGSFLSYVQQEAQTGGAAGGTGGGQGGLGAT